MFNTKFRKLFYILEYILRYWRSFEEKKSTVEISAAEEESFTIKDLTPSTRYFVDIQAVTKVGVGPQTEISFESGLPPG